MTLMGMIFFDGLRLLCYDFLICPEQIMMVIPPVNPSLKSVRLLTGQQCSNDLIFFFLVYITSG
jgi:hypothetical protein